MQADLARIAFVSRRFNELKGLPTVVGGATALLALLLFSIAGGRAANAYSGVLIVIISASNIFEYKYRAAFGNPVCESPSDRLSQLLTSLPLAMMAGVLWDRLADIGRIAGPSGAAVAVGCVSLAVLVRDLRWRPHYAVPLAAAVFGVIITAITEPTHPLQSWERDPRRAPVFFVAYAAIAFGTVVAGLFDYRLLTSVLSIRPRSREETTPVPGSSRWFRFALFASASFGLGALLPEPYVAITLSAPFLVGMFLTMTLPSPSPLRTATLGLHSGSGSPDSDSPDPEVTLPSARTLIPLLVLSASAAADIVRPASAPLFLPTALGICALWIALRGLRRRQHYLAGVIASAVAVVLGAYLEPLQALAVFLSATAAAVALVLFIDGRAARQSDWPNADTI